MTKLLGDYTLREIYQVCKPLKAKYKGGACEHCPFNREYECEEGCWCDCMVTYFDCIDDDEEYEDTFLNKPIKE